MIHPHRDESKHVYLPFPSISVYCSSEPLRLLLRHAQNLTLGTNRSIIHTSIYIIIIIIIINTCLWHTNLEEYIRLNVDAVHCQYEWIVAHGYACGAKARGYVLSFWIRVGLIGTRMSVTGVRPHSQTHQTKLTFEALNHIMSRSQICETYLPCYLFL